MFVRERTVRTMASAWLASTAAVFSTNDYKNVNETVITVSGPSIQQTLSMYIK